jgi:hypothetical protein
LWRVARRRWPAGEIGLPSPRVAPKTEPLTRQVSLNATDRTASPFGCDSSEGMSGRTRHKRPPRGPTIVLPWPMSGHLSRPKALAAPSVALEWGCRCTQPHAAPKRLGRRVNGTSGPEREARLEGRGFNARQGPSDSSKGGPNRRIRLGMADLGCSTAQMRALNLRPFSEGWRSSADPRSGGALGGRPSGGRRVGEVM